MLNIEWGERGVAGFACPLFKKGGGVIMTIQKFHKVSGYGSYRLSNVEIALTVGVTGQKGMLTPPWHLIPRLIYSEVHGRPFSDLYFL
jgi:hypothetical protein